jgi:uncharacterized LabA/DUF88 family protein
MVTTAVLVDGAFFLRRYPYLYPAKDAADPSAVARTMHEMACAHLYDKGGNRACNLYRIFFYDCSGIRKRAHNPISGRAVDFARSAITNFRDALHDEVRRLRKTALRLGRLDEDNAAWTIHDRVLRELFKGTRRFEDLNESDIVYYARQKQVDMKIGLDISALAHKRQVDQIVLVAGDSDFVPAAKVARREGIDFILDPMWHVIKPDLNEHIDGLRSTAPRPSPKPIAAIKEMADL